MGHLAVPDLSINFSLNINAQFSIGNQTPNSAPQCQRAANDVFGQCMRDPCAWNAEKLFKALVAALIKQLQAQQAQCEQPASVCASSQPQPDQVPVIPDSGGGGGNEGGGAGPGGAGGCNGGTDGGGGTCGGND